MALPTNQEIDNAIRTSNTGTDADRPIRSSTNELLKAFRQEIANTQQDLANKVSSSAFNGLADVARTGNYNDINGRPQQYGGTGQNTDGYMTQKAATDALGDKADLVGGKVPFEQLPSSLASGVVFKGTWSATANQDNSGNPLPATPINDGEYYIVNTAGTQFGLTFAAGDWIIAVDGQWYKLEPDSTVSSVNGQTGAVVIDVGVTSVGITVPTGIVVTNTPITSAGTIDITLAEGYKIPTEAELEDKGIEPPAGWLEVGSETKYLAGDGTLKDIPSDTQSDYAQTNPNAPDYIKNKPVLFSGSYDDLEDKPTIPTKTSELTNDSEFITDASLAGLVSDAELSDALSTKVSKETGKVLSTNDYSDADKAKLTSLEGSHFRGVYINEAALSEISDPVAGDYADVDAGEGSDAKRWIYDASDDKWVAQESASSLTASQVKQLYESNEDTNAFTDDDKSKLSGLGTAATKDVGTDTGNVMGVGAFGLGSYLSTNSQFTYETPLSGFGYSGANPALGMAGPIIKAHGTRSFIITARGYRVAVQTIGQDGNPIMELIHTGNILSATGQSTSYPMTQKAVTDALATKVDKVQAKEILTTNKTLTAADSGKLLIINADGITITMPANSDFNIDIAKMDEGFTTIVQCKGTDKFREETAAISVIRDVSITNSGISGKEWLAIGAYEV